MDIDGFEEYRIYLGKDGKTPAKIQSGVCGRHLAFNKDNGKLIKASNVDENKVLVADIEGYITTLFFYDSLTGKQIRESYVDEKGKNKPTVSKEIAQVWDYEQNEDGFSLIASNIGEDNNYIPFDPDCCIMTITTDHTNNSFWTKKGMCRKWQNYLIL